MNPFSFLWPTARGALFGAAFSGLLALAFNLRGQKLKWIVFIAALAGGIIGNRLASQTAANPAAQETDEQFLAKNNITNLPPAGTLKAPDDLQPKIIAAAPQATSAPGTHDNGEVWWPSDDGQVWWPGEDDADSLKNSTIVPKSAGEPARPPDVTDPKAPDKQYDQKDPSKPAPGYWWMKDRYIKQPPGSSKVIPKP